MIVLARSNSQSSRMRVTLLSEVTDLKLDYTGKQYHTHILDPFKLTRTDLAELCENLIQRVACDEMKIEIVLFDRHSKREITFEDANELQMKNDLPDILRLSRLEISSAGYYSSDTGRSIKIKKPTLSILKSCRFEMDVISNDEGWNAGIIEVVKNFTNRHRLWYFSIYWRTIFIPTYLIALIAMFVFNFIFVLKLNLEPKLITVIYFGLNLGTMFLQNLIVRGLGFILPTAIICNDYEFKFNYKLCTAITSIIIAICAVLALIFQIFR